LGTRLTPPSGKRKVNFDDMGGRGVIYEKNIQEFCRNIPKEGITWKMQK
jgi:hypothetical protein